MPEAVGRGVAAAFVRPVPDQVAGAGGVDVAGRAVGRHRRLVVVQPVGAGQRVLQPGLEALQLVGPPGDAGGDEPGRHRGVEHLTEHHGGTFHAHMPQIGDLGDGGTDVRPVTHRAGDSRRRRGLRAMPGGATALHQAVIG